MARDIITNEQWKRLRPLLPPQKPKTGRPAKNHRVVVNGILWLMRTGAPWRDLPTEYGPWQTVASRFYRWRRAGVWEHILQTLQQQTDANGQIDWEVDIIELPTDKPWGLREMQIRDPDGLSIVIIEVPESHPLRSR
jgi:transposase